MRHLQSTTLTNKISAKTLSRSFTTLYKKLETARAPIFPTVLDAHLLQYSLELLFGAITAATGLIQFSIFISSYSKRLKAQCVQIPIFVMKRLAFFLKIGNEAYKYQLM